MQFKYPELLWGLFLLITPIIIHLFQLRKFKKTPFTNVKLLKEVISESRKSSSIKKWLLLLSRLGILTALVLAFAQPFFAKETALREKETVLYIDNSFSMESPSENGSLLSATIQELLKEAPKDQKVSLFTNDKVFKNVDLKEIKNDLLSLNHSTKQLPLDAVLFKAKTLFSKDTTSIKNTIVISDFQKSMFTSKIDSSSKTNTYFIVKRPENITNISIDSLFIEAKGTENLNVTAKLSSNTTVESTPVSLYNGAKLIAKTSAVFHKNKKATVTFTLQKKDSIKGRIHIEDKGLKYDNSLYFNIDTKAKIKVLVIGKENSFLKRIYRQDEFSLSGSLLKNLNYSVLQKQNTIVLNALNSIPNALTNALLSFTKNGGTLLILPSANIEINSYNHLTSRYFATTIDQKITEERKIATIAFNHPIYNQVFKKKVINFQYPIVKSTYQLKTNAPKILSYQNNRAFLIGKNGFYMFCADIANENSNFKNSPLIVPTLYNIGALSLKTPQLYTQLGSKSVLEIPLELGKDHILSIEKEGYQFIPRQESYANKAGLFFKENPIYSGIYQIKNKKKVIQNISFNYSREESNLNYASLDNFSSNKTKTSLKNLFQDLQKDNAINALWKWFITLALLFILLEILLQKFLK